MPVPGCGGRDVYLLPATHGGHALVRLGVGCSYVASELEISHTPRRREGPRHGHKTLSRGLLIPHVMVDVVIGLVNEAGRFPGIGKSGLDGPGAK